MSEDQRTNRDIQTWQSNWKWEARVGNGHGSTQRSKGASLSIPKMKELRTEKKLNDRFKKNLTT